MDLKQHHWHERNNFFKNIHHIFNTLHYCLQNLCFAPLSSLSFPNTNSDIRNTIKLKSFRYVDDVDEALGNASSEWLDALHVPVTKSAFDLYEEELKLSRISTTIRQLDECLAGGFKIGHINEIIGDTGSGKTQICFRICVDLLISNNEQIFFINTNRNFNIQRIEDLISTYDQYADISTQIEREEFIKNILKRLFIIDIYNYTELIAVVKHMECWLENNKVRLVLVDSICMPLRILDMKERKCAINNLLTNLQKLAIQHKFAIILTNNLTTNFQQNQGIAYFGDNFFHRVNTRIQLIKSKAVYQVKLIKSTDSLEVLLEFNL